MTPEKDADREQGHRRDAGVPKPKDIKSQGIVRDQRGQEQPADKERAQHAPKTENAG